MAALSSVVVHDAAFDVGKGDVLDVLGVERGDAKPGAESRMAGGVLDDPIYPDVGDMRIALEGGSRLPLLDTEEKMVRIIRGAAVDHPRFPRAVAENAESPVGPVGDLIAFKRRCQSAPAAVGESSGRKDRASLAFRSRCGNCGNAREDAVDIGRLKGSPIKGDGRQFGRTVEVVGRARCRQRKGSSPMKGQTEERRTTLERLVSD